MNSQDWLRKYYPIEPSQKMTKRQAIEHSLRKWKGLLPKILEKHELEKMGRFVVELYSNAHILEIDASSCALCVKYIGNKYSQKLDECTACPLAKHLGNPCDKSGYGNRPYSTWKETGDARPMIKALKALLEEK